MTKRSIPTELTEFFGHFKNKISQSPNKDLKKQVLCDSNA